MTVDVPLSLIFQTAITGMVGWVVKLLLDSVKAYRDESKVWRDSMDRKIDDINSATQATMRTTILHYCEKYLTRGWVTSEELASLNDMHTKYAALNPKNGFINGYIARVNNLEVKEI